LQLPAHHTNPTHLCHARTLTMGLLTRLGAVAVGGVAMVVPGGQLFGMAALAWAIRPPDPVEIGIAIALHPMPLLGFILS